MICTLIQGEKFDLQEKKFHLMEANKKKKKKKLPRHYSHGARECNIQQQMRSSRTAKVLGEKSRKSHKMGNE